MLLPIGMDIPLKRTPWVNYFLIAINLVIFLLTFNFHPTRSPYQSVLHDWAIMYQLHPIQPDLFQFISYAFLHAGWAHLLGNMYFLYMFGNNVNAKLGNIGYALLYLGGAVFSGVGHAAFFDSPVLGASGAVAAVTGAYMVLFPNSYLKIMYFFFFIGVFEIRALYFILLKLIILDNWLPTISHIQSNVAFFAHLSGYLYGIGIPLLLLATHLLEHSTYDLWALISRWQKRKSFQRVVADGYDPFSGQADAVNHPAEPIDTHTKAQREAITQLRSGISEALAQRDLSAAAQFYLELLEVDAKQVLAEQPQLDIANKLMHNGQQAQAAAAYESFLTHYPRYAFTEQIHLMLGLIYARYLNQNDRAVHYLKLAVDELRDPGQKQMCQDELNRLQNKNI